MVKRSPGSGFSAQSSKPASPFSSWAAEKEETDHKQHVATGVEAKTSLKKGKSIEKKGSSDSWYHDSSFIHLLSSMLKVGFYKDLVVVQNLK